MKEAYRVEYDLKQEGNEAPLRCAGDAAISSGGILF
jgi:hypothetical protein